MKIFTLAQSKLADQYTIKNEPISSINLMERAAQACSIWILNHFIKTESFVILCGNGNNGGDGFAIARMLYNKGHDVRIFTNLNQKFSEDVQINLNKAKEISGIEMIDFEHFENTTFKGNEIFIDALFGIGLNRNISGKWAEIILKINKLPQYKISIDVPSGIFVDKNINTNSIVLKANQTLSFQFWKKAFLHPETGKYCGEIEILNIGLDSGFIDYEKSDNFIIDESLITSIYKPRNPFSHKGDFGKTCIIGGSYGKIGAVVLAVKAALRTGSGRTFALAPNCGYEILQVSCPEAMFISGGEKFINSIKNEEDFTLGIGPGMGQNQEVESTLISFLKTYKKPLVLDADALNILSNDKKSLELIPKNSIITPHPKEFERLFGKTSDSFERLNLAKTKAKEFSIFIVLKDHHTQIITPEGRVFYNINGNAGLAKGGSGDVLTGIITSLLSQNYSFEEAAIFGVWLHGKAADLATENIAQESLLATDVVNSIAEGFKKL